jgi:chromosome segregation and condensation protein ScpB
MTICAYLDSPTKNEISFIRGVQSSQSIRSLSARGLLKREGERYSLSIDAIKSLGISSLQDLPEYEKIKKDFEERLKDILKEE